MPSLEDWATQQDINDKSSQNGNTAFAQQYSKEIRDVVFRYAARMPRSMQRHLGPSELGHQCDRQLVGKMAGVNLGNGNSSQLHDPWASYVGTAIHASMDDAFKWDAAEPDPDKLDMENGKNPGRWEPERRVTPDPESDSPHPGTADLYDHRYKAVVDWKCQSEGVRDKLKRNGPPPHYWYQMLLYSLGYMNEGFPVERMILVSLPRTKSSMDDIYCYEHVITQADLDATQDILRKTEAREQLAQIVASGDMDLFDIPATPSDSDCAYCPYFNPRAALDKNIRACPGTAAK